VSAREGVRGCCSGWGRVTFGGGGATYLFCSPQAVSSSAANAIAAPHAMPQRCFAMALLVHTQNVARMERSGCGLPFPDFAPLHPGYDAAFHLSRQYKGGGTFL